MADPVNVDIGGYLRQKQEGVASIIKIDGVAHLRMKPVPQPQSMVPVNREGIEAGIKAKKDEIAILEEILKDIDAAKELV